MIFPDTFLDDLRARLPTSDVVKRRIPELKRAGSEWKCLSPFNKESTPSFTVNDRKAFWHDFSSGKSGDIFKFEMEMTGCTFVTAVETLAQLAGVPLPDRPGRRGKPQQQTQARDPRDDDAIPDPEPDQYAAGARSQAPRREITKTYDYTDPDGGMRYQVCRLEWRDGAKRRKTFLQRRPVPGADGWIWGLAAGEYLRARDGDYYQATEERIDKWKGAERRTFEDVAHGLYRFPELMEEMAQEPDERRLIVIAEGEKDVETLAAWGVVATTSSGGARHWLPHHAEYLRGADVVILLDNDKAGREGGHKKAASLRGIARRVRVLDWRTHWESCPDKADVTDWRDHAGGNAGKLFAIVEKLGDWVPEAPESGFGAVRFVDLDKPARELEWLIKNVMTRNEVSIWFGPPGCGKTFLITDASLAIARAVPWFGLRTRPGLVIYQAGEGGLGVKMRLRAYRRHHKIPHDEDVPFVLLPNAVDLYAADADVTKLIAEIKAWAAFYDVPLELVVIDTLSAATPGANENASEDITKVLSRCRRVARETGAHVALVHHTNAKGDRPRGHSSLQGNVDNAIEVIRTEQVDSEADGDRNIMRDIREFVTVKQKDAPDKFRRQFILRQVVMGEDSDGDAVTSCVVTALASQEVVDRSTVPQGYLQLHAANIDIMRALVRALKNNGQYGAPGCPEHERACKVGSWQNELIQTYVGHEEITDTLRERLKKRIFRAAKSWGPDGSVRLIGKAGEWIWRTERLVHQIDPPPQRRRTSPNAPGAQQAAMVLAPGERAEDMQIDP